MIYIILAIVLLVITFTLLGTLVWGNIEPKKKFIAVGNGDAAVAVSYDGKNWETIENVLGVNTVGIGIAIAKGGGGKWVVVGNDGDDEGDNIWWSNDGDIWNAANSTEDDSGVFGNSPESNGLDVIYADNLWVSVGVDGTDRTRCIWWSEDGEEWTPHLGDNFGTDTDMSAYVVKYDNGIWFVGGTWGNVDGSPILWSEDGMEWTSVDFPDTDLNPAVFDLAYDNGVWAAIGYNDEGGAIWYSEDNGENWTAVDENFFDVGNSITVFAGIWVAVGDGGDMVWYSEDGINWSIASYPTEILLESGLANVKYLNDKFYAFGSGYIIQSVDGITWTAVDFQNDVMTEGAYGNDKYVTIGTGNDSIYYSLDGDTWNAVDNQPFGEGASLYDIIYA